LALSAGSFVKIINLLIALAVLIVAGFALYIALGAYPVGADVPHSGPAYWVLTTVRDRSVAAQARGISAPADLENPQRLAVGAGHYASMCSGCHLAPGYESSEIWTGLYPQPPPLAQGVNLTPAEMFWVIKHGLKFSGMPAWGQSHSDSEIWDITAFVLKLPHLTAAQYKDIVTHAPPDIDMMRMPMPGEDATEKGSPAHKPMSMP
jgi:mono/diheme cytochrome c family protein